MPARLCPVCGAYTERTYCPADGTRTLDAVSSARHGELAAGDIVAERYRIAETIGRGGFCTVYAATHVGTGQNVALKLLDRVDDAVSAPQRFFREARLTASLRHPHTVRVFDVGQIADGALYLAMEHLTGPTLEAELDQRLSVGETILEAEAIDLAIQVLGSLDEAHRAGLVHRDLKPANLVLCTADDVGERSDGGEALHVKVLDFGIARTSNSALTGEHSTLGTPGYMSPEQCQGQPLDGRSDLYSLGVVLWECVCGALPFDGDNPMAVMFATAHDPIPSLQRRAKTPVGSGFVRCVQRALAKHPAERFASAAEMRAAFEALVTTRIASVRTSSAAVRRPTLDESVVASISRPATPAPTPAARAPDTGAEGDHTKMIIFVGVLISLMGMIAYLVGHSLESPSDVTPAPIAAPDAR